MSRNAHNAYLSCAHLNRTSLTDLFHKRNERGGSEVPPEKNSQWLISLSY